MKLKKIASLALAGIMAVSMLAGCKGSDSNSNNSASSNNTNPATGVSATFASNLTNKDVITWADDSVNQRALALALENLNNSSIKTDDAGLDFKTFSDVPFVDVAKYIAFNNTTGVYGVTSTVAQAVTTKTTWANMFSMSGDVDQDVVLKAVADYLNATISGDNFKSKTADTTAQNRAYTYKYTGSVSMQKKTSDDGKDSAWYILVTVTSNPSKVM